MVMMTSEFNFDDLMNTENFDDLTISFTFARLMFLGFLILTAIVLMNLMIGVAVNDLHNLQMQGNIQRLKMQVEFLTALENLVQNDIFKKILPKRITSNILIPKVISLSPNKRSQCPARIRVSAFNIGLNQKKQTQEHLISVNIENKYKPDDKSVNLYTQYDKKNMEGINKKHTANDFENLELMWKEVTSKLNETGQSIESLNVKLDSILKRLDNISK